MYSNNLAKMLKKIEVYQPALVEMLKYYLLEEGASFIHQPWGDEYPYGQVSHSAGCLFLYEDHLELLASASKVGPIANSITEYTYCAWCRVKIQPIADGLRHHDSLSLKASWATYK